MKYILFSIALIFIYSCAPSRYVEPLKHKELAVGISFGGPVIDFGGPIPIPLTSIDAGYGIDTNLTVFAALHTTSLFFGDFQTDFGMTYRFLKQKKYIPNLSVSPSINIIKSFSEDAFKLWPVLDLNAYWNYGERNNYFYLGVNNYIELSKTIALEQPQIQRVLWNPQIGHIIKGKKKPWQLSLEMKFLGPNIDNTKSFIDYKSILINKGAAGIFVGYKWIF